MSITLECRDSITATTTAWMDRAAKLAERHGWTRIEESAGTGNTVSYASPSALTASITLMATPGRKGSRDRRSAFLSTVDGLQDLRVDSLGPAFEAWGATK